MWCLESNPGCMENGPLWSLADLCVCLSVCVCGNNGKLKLHCCISRTRIKGVRTERLGLFLEVLKKGDC